MSDYDFLTNDTPITDPNQLIQDNSKIMDRISQRRQLLQDEEHKPPLLSDLKTYLLSCDANSLKYIYTYVTGKSSTNDERAMDIINHMLWYFSDKTLVQTKKIIETIYNIKSINNVDETPTPISPDRSPDSSDDGQAANAVKKSDYFPVHDWKKYSDPIWSVNESVGARLNLIQQIIKTLPDLTTDKLQTIYDCMLLC
jgi:hypothetical protein